MNEERRLTDSTTYVDVKLSTGSLSKLEYRNQGRLAGGMITVLAESGIALSTRFTVERNELSRARSRTIVSAREHATWRGRASRLDDLRTVHVMRITLLEEAIGSPSHLKSLFRFLVATQCHHGMFGYFD